MKIKVNQNKIYSRICLFQGFTRVKNIYEFYIYKYNYCKRDVAKKENLDKYIKFNLECVDSLN